MTARKMCAAGRKLKVCIPTREEAERELESAQFVRSKGIGNGKVEARVYHCPVCWQFHLTSQKKPNKRK